MVGDLCRLSFAIAYKRDTHGGKERKWKLMWIKFYGSENLKGRIWAV